MIPLDMGSPVNYVDINFDIWISKSYRKVPVHFASSLWMSEFQIFTIIRFTTYQWGEIGSNRTTTNEVQYFRLCTVHVQQANGHWGCTSRHADSRTFPQIPKHSPERDNLVERNITNIESQEICLSSEIYEIYIFELRTTIISHSPKATVKIRNQIPTKKQFFLKPASLQRHIDTFPRKRK